MKCAIMQPTYIPWAGYFNLIANVDFFIFLDDVQYEKGSWQNRNKLIVNGQPCWITVPVNRHFLGQTILDSMVDEQKNWRRKHAQLIEQNYRRHPYFKDLSRILEVIADPNLSALCTLNKTIINIICEQLEIHTPCFDASTLNIQALRTTRLIKICEHFKCDEYLSPIGAKEYLEADDFTGQTSIKLKFNEFEPPCYPQKNTDIFVSHLSIVDVIANVGVEQTKEYIRFPVIREQYAAR